MANFQILGKVKNHYFSIKIDDQEDKKVISNKTKELPPPKEDFTTYKENEAKRLKSN